MRWKRADKDSADQYLKQLEVRIRAEAKAIHDKYVAPPRTTDFRHHVPSSGRAFLQRCSVAPVSAMHSNGNIAWW